MGGGAVRASRVRPLGSVRRERDAGRDGIASPRGGSTGGAGKGSAASIASAQASTLVSLALARDIAARQVDLARLMSAVDGGDEA